MTSGRKNIDYGPMALPVGEVSEARTARPSRDQLQTDSARLQLILARSAAPAEAPMHALDELVLENETDSRQFEELSDFELGQELERLWVCNGAGGLREVRLRLAPQLIPGTWVRILSHGGELRVELSAASDQTRNWLDRASEKLANELATRLRCAVCIVIKNAAGVESACAAFEWKGASNS